MEVSACDRTEWGGAQFEVRVYREVGGVEGYMSQIPEKHREARQGGALMRAPGTTSPKRLKISYRDKIRLAAHNRWYALAWMLRAPSRALRDT